MASGDTLLVFLPLAYEPPSSNYATLALRNGHPTLQFNDTTQYSAIWTGVLPRNYGGSGVTVLVHWTAVATSGTGGWDVAFERMSDSTTDIDSDSFATAQTITAVTVPGTSGVVSVNSVAVSNGANMDSIAVGESFRLRVRRDVATDTAVGNLELLAVEIRET